MSAQNQQTKAAVSVSEMARMVSLSRARFYELMDAGSFPKPSYDPDTGRPYFVEDQQIVCLEVRRRNCGVDGKPILFYARRVESRPTDPRPRKPTMVKTQDDSHDVHDDILESVKALGLKKVTAAQVKAAVIELFPEGVAAIDRSEVVRAVFILMNRQRPTAS